MLITRTFAGGTTHGETAVDRMFETDRWNARKVFDVNASGRSPRSCNENDTKAGCGAVEPQAEELARTSRQADIAVLQTAPAKLESTVAFVLPKLASQSPDETQRRPGTHGGQSSPPQSTSVSALSLMPLRHDSGTVAVIEGLNDREGVSDGVKVELRDFVSVMEGLRVALGDALLLGVVAEL